MPRKSHTHKYIKRPTKSSPVWACALPDCNHFMPNHLADLVVGRTSFCWQCDEKFILDEDAITEDKPRCFGCRNGIDTENVKNIEDYLNSQLFNKSKH